MRRIATVRASAAVKNYRKFAHAPNGDGHGREFCLQGAGQDLHCASRVIEAPDFSVIPSRFSAGRWMSAYGPVVRD